MKSDSGALGFLKNRMTVDRNNIRESFGTPGFMGESRLALKEVRSISDRSEPLLLFERHRHGREDALVSLRH
jgi:hypothetical protein